MRSSPSQVSMKMIDILLTMSIGVAQCVVWSGTALVGRRVPNSVGRDVTVSNVFGNPYNSVVYVIYRIDVSRNSLRALK